MFVYILHKLGRKKWFNIAKDHETWGQKEGFFWGGGWWTFSYCLSFPIFSEFCLPIVHSCFLLWFTILDHMLCDPSQSQTIWQLDVMSSFSQFDEFTWELLNGSVMLLWSPTRVRKMLSVLALNGWKLCKSLWTITESLRSFSVHGKIINYHQQCFKIFISVTGQGAFFLALWMLPPVVIWPSG